MANRCARRKRMPRRAGSATALAGDVVRREPIRTPPSLYSRGAPATAAAHGGAAPHAEFAAPGAPPTSPGGDGGRETPRVNVLHQRDVGTAGGRAGDGEWGGGEARVETGKCRPSLSGTRPASTAPWRVPDSHSRAASECDRLRARSVACRGHRAIRPTLRRIGRSPRI